MAEGPDGHLFKAEYDREMEQWLRRRFGWLLGSLIAYELLSLLFAIAGLILFRLNGDALPIPPDAGARPRRASPVEKATFCLRTVTALRGACNNPLS